MNAKQRAEIQRLKNSIRGDEYIIERRPDLADRANARIEETTKLIAELEA